jgi:hypothetical protein
MTKPSQAGERGAAAREGWAAGGSAGRQRQLDLFGAIMAAGRQQAYELTTTSQPTRLPHRTEAVYARTASLPIMRQTRWLPCALR